MEIDRDCANARSLPASSSTYILCCPFNISIHPPLFFQQQNCHFSVHFSSSNPMRRTADGDDSPTTAATATSTTASTSPPPTGNGNANGGWRKGGGLLGLISAEPAMLLFMCSALAKFPVFQSLLYEKACRNSGRYEPHICENISITHKDFALQKEANHLLLASSFCLLLPSIPTALLLGALFDSWSSRKAQLIPLAGLFLADLNYMAQTAWPDSSAYWLLLSDLCFGFAGGFTSIIGLLFAYSVRVTSPSFRSARVAIMEGCMGLGGMCGYLLSGYLRQRFGYVWVFTLLTAMHMVVFLYVLLFVRELVDDSVSAASSSSLPLHRPPPEEAETAETKQAEQAPDSTSSCSSCQQSQDDDRRPLPLLPRCWLLCRNRMADIVLVYSNADRDPQRQLCLNIVLLALGIELISFSGLMDILFSFLRFQLQWTDKEYGLFNGIGTGLASFCVISLYPLLQKRVGISNLALAQFGLITKIGSVLILAFTSSTLLAMLSILPAAFGRFISSGLRAMASACVGQDEQGKVFSLISLLEAVAFLVASLFFNGLYPYTLQWFAGTMLLVVAFLLLVPVGLLLWMQIRGIGTPRTRENNSI